MGLRLVPSIPGRVPFLSKFRPAKKANALKALVAEFDRCRPDVTEEFGAA
jgi:hypothetical protein